MHIPQLSYHPEGVGYGSDIPLKPAIAVRIFSVVPLKSSPLLSSFLPKSETYPLPHRLVHTVHSLLQALKVAPYRSFQAGSFPKGYLHC